MNRRSPARNLAPVQAAFGDGVLDVAPAQQEADRPRRTVLQGAVVVIAQEVVHVQVGQQT